MEVIREDAGGGGGRGEEEEGGTRCGIYRHRTIAKEDRKKMKGEGKVRLEVNKAEGRFVQLRVLHHFGVTARPNSSSTLG